MQDVASALYEEARAFDGFEAPPFIELKKSLKEKDVLTVQKWEQIAERAKKIFNYMPSPDADTTDNRPWVGPRTTPDAGNRP